MPSACERIDQQKKGIKTLKKISLPTPPVLIYPKASDHPSLIKKTTKTTMEILNIMVDKDIRRAKTLLQ